MNEKWEPVRIEHGNEPFCYNMIKRHYEYDEYGRVTKISFVDLDNKPDTNSVGIAMAYYYNPGIVLSMAKFVKPDTTYIANKLKRRGSAFNPAYRKVVEAKPSKSVRKMTPVEFFLDARKYPEAIYTPHAISFRRAQTVSIRKRLVRNETIGLEYKPSAL